MNRSSIGRSGCQYHEYCLQHCMGLIVWLQHNGTRDLRGCMIMQSTTWPRSAGVFSCRQSNARRSKRTWSIRESCLRLVPELLVTVCDAISGFDCCWCSSRLMLSSTAQQIRTCIYPCLGLSTLKFGELSLICQFNYP